MIRICVSRAAFALAVSALVAAPTASAQRIDTVAVGRQPLDPAIFRPYADTIDIYLVRGTARELVGTFYTSLEPAPAGSGGEYVLRARTGSVVYMTVVHSRTLAPVHHRTEAPTDSADVAFEPTRIRGWVVPQGKPLSTIDIPLEPQRYPFMDAGTVMRGLPLTAGYVAAIQAFDPYSEGPSLRLARVVGSDTLTYRGRHMDAWIVEEVTDAGVPVRRNWIAKDSRRLLKALNLRMKRTDGAEQWWFLR